MTPFASPLSRRLVAALLGGCCLLAVFAGCGRSHPAGRPATSLSERDRAILDKYELVRAALADDNLRDARVAAGTLALSLKPADAKAPASPVYLPATMLSVAPALDRGRQIFKLLSAQVVPLAVGVEGFYVMTCPMPSCGDWVQRTPQVSNPYMGKTLHDFGEVKK